MPDLPDDERSDMMEVEPPSLPPDMIESRPHGRPDISQRIRQQNADDNSVGLALGESSGVKPRKRTSQVWKHFVKFKDANGNDRAKCNHCNKDYDADSRSGTSRLRNHLKSKSCQRKRNGDGDGDNLVGNLSDTIAIEEKSVMDQQWNHLDVARMIVKRGKACPIDSTNKGYIIELYRKEEEKLWKYFKDCLCRLCLTFHKSELENDQFSCLMVWFIDDDWKLKNKILKHFDTNEADGMEDVKHVLREWGIQSKLSSMVIESIDDCNLYKGDDWFSNQGSLLFNNELLCNKTFVSGFFRFVCENLYESLTRLVNNISETSNENFRNAPTKNELETLKFHGEYSNLMGVLKNVLGLKESGFELANIDPHFKILTKEKWDVLRAIDANYEEWDFLQQYCCNYKTANAYFPLLCSIRKCSQELTKCHINDFCHDLIERAWCEYNLVLAVASVLDPRFKMDIVEDWYKEIFGDQWKKEFEDFNHSFIDIYNGYARETNSSISDKMLDPLGKPCKSYYELNHVQLIKSDLDHYLKEDKFLPFEDFDVLEWWRVHARQFPTLARMARDFLSIQIHSPPSLVSDNEIHHLEDLHYAEDSDDEMYCTQELGIKEAYIYTKSWLAT